MRKERKVVTVLFADLVGFTARSESLDPEDVEAILRPYHDRLRVELEQRGGTVEKFVGDAVMAVFGAPVAHEDDPERAVRAALAIRDGIVEDGTLEVRVGVNTGEALVNVDARPDHGEGMVAGDVVNTAARLQSSAPTNGILVGEATQRATSHAIDYRGHEPIDAKGKSEPVAVWEAVEAKARVGVELRAPATPLVGRERERELVLGAFDRVRAERSTQLLTIVGVPGIGKSRLVAELYGALEREAELTFWRQGRSLPYGEGLAFWAFAEMVKAQAGILETDSADAAERKLREAVAALASAEDAAWIESRLRPLVGLETAAVARDESFGAWRRLVESLADQRPTVLVFEDLHWADDDLLDFVDELVDWVENVPLLVVATARPELLDRRPNWGGGKRNALTVSLPPLGDEDTARLFGALLARSVLPADTQQALIARAGGNPLYAEQFARMLDERGEVGDLPETVQGIVAARLDSLPLEEKRLVMDAAVLGKTFWLGALEGEDVEGRLRALQRKDFVRRERRSTVAGETEFTFAHLLVRDVAYTQIPRGDRADKHALAVRWLESLAEDRSEDRAELLAHHLLAALEFGTAAGRDVDELIDPAIDALLEATERALKLAAFAQAERSARQALELVSMDDPRRPRCLLGLAAAEGDLGKPECVEHAGEAAETYRTLGDLESAAQAETEAAIWLWGYGRRDEAHAAAKRALALVRDAPPSKAKAAAHVTYARLLMLAARPREAIELGRAGLQLAEELDEVPLQASVLITIGTAFTQLGEGGIVELERGIDIADRQNVTREFTRGNNNLAEHLLAQGELAETQKLYGVMLERSERLGMLQGVAWTVGQEVALAHLTGDWGRSDELAERFRELVVPMSGHYLETQVNLVRAAIGWARADPAADELSQRVLEASRDLKDPQALGPALSSRARLLLESGRRDEAAALADEILELRDNEGRALYFTYLIDLGWLLHDLDRAGEMPLSRQASVWNEAGETIARDDLVGAAEILERAGMRTEEAYARLRAAEQLAAAGRAPEAQAQLDSALAFYRGVGATVYVRRAEALLPASA